MVERVLAPAGGRAVTVVWQSVVTQYLSAETRSRIDDLVGEAGGRATEENLLVYARMEPGTHPTPGFGVRVTHWPDGESVLLGSRATTGPL